MNRHLVKTMIAGAAIPKRRIVKYGADGRPVPSAAAADLHIGVSDNAADIAAGERVEVVLSGLPEVEAGTSIAFGASVTADADGKAVTAATGDIAIGWAYAAAEADGDIIDIMPGRHTAA